MSTAATLALVSEVEVNLVALHQQYLMHKISSQAFWDQWAAEERRLPAGYGWSAALGRVVGPDWPQVR